MQGVYKMRLATFYWEINRSYNEQLVGEDRLAKILQNLEKASRTYRTDRKIRCKDSAIKKNPTAELPGRKAALAATLPV